MPPRPPADKAHLWRVRGMQGQVHDRSKMSRTLPEASAFGTSLLAVLVRSCLAACAGACPDFSQGTVPTWGPLR